MLVRPSRQRSHSPQETPAPEATTSPTPNRPPVVGLDHLADELVAEDHRPDVAGHGVDAVDRERPRPARPLRRVGAAHAGAQDARAAPRRRPARGRARPRSGRRGRRGRPAARITPPRRARGSPRPASVFRCDCELRSVGQRAADGEVALAGDQQLLGRELRDHLAARPRSPRSPPRCARRRCRRPRASRSRARRTCPPRSTSGWSSETSREKIGFSQIDSPTPWPYCRANAASSSGKPNSWAVGPHARRCRPSSRPAAPARSRGPCTRGRGCRRRCWARLAEPTAKVR